jgi:hypothetical protein
MNAREFRLLLLLGVVLGGGGASIAIYQWFYKPLVTYNATIAKLDSDNADKAAKLQSTYAEIKDLERARLMSLSPNPDMAKAEYIVFLDRLLDTRYSGLKYDIKENPVIESRATGQGSGAPKPGHQIVGFEVRATGSINSLVRVLELFQKTPLVHRIKGLRIARDTSAKNAPGQLQINLTIESLIVSKAEPRADGPLAPDQRLIVIETMMALRRGPTGLGLLPWVVGPTGPLAQQRLWMDTGYRLYADIGRKNIFTGPAERKQDKVEEEELIPTIDVIQYIRLDTTDPAHKEAYFRNLAVKMPTRKGLVKAVPGSGYDTFRFYNEWNTAVVIKGKVLQVEQRDVYFQVQDEVFRVHLGQSLADAIGRGPLSDYEMELRGLTSLYDAEWGAREAKEPQQGFTKKKGKGR